MWLPFHHLISLPSQSASDKIENTDDWILHGWKRARNWTKRKLQCTSFYNHVWGELLLIGSLKRQNWPMPCPPLLQLSALIWCEYTSKSAPPEPITHNHVCIRTSVYPLSISPCLYYIYNYVCIYIYMSNHGDASLITEGTETWFSTWQNCISTCWHQPPRKSAIRVAEPQPDVIASWLVTLFHCH